MAPHESYERCSGRVVGRTPGLLERHGIKRSEPKRQLLGQCSEGAILCKIERGASEEAAAIAA